MSSRPPSVLRTGFSDRKPHGTAERGERRGRVQVLQLGPPTPGWPGQTFRLQGRGPPPPVPRHSEKDVLSLNEETDSECPRDLAEVAEPLAAALA